MKRIINGKKYDTETATKIAVDDADCPANDFKYWIERLYKKNNGEFFLQGEGGPMSHYVKKTCDNSWSGSEQIIPFSEDEAKEWVQIHANDMYEDIFGEVSE